MMSKESVGAERSADQTACAMRIFSLCIFFGVLLGLPGASTAQTLSPPPPTVELYTMGQGEILFEKFGHAALCLRYENSPQKDACFNYGTSNFADPLPLVWGFLRGEANFWVSRIRPAAMLAFYKQEDRTIWRQKLPLTPEQARAIEAKLLSDIRPENRYYNYHHFYDNCTTRLRDIIDEATQGALSQDSGEKVGPTFREFGRQGFAEQLWILVASDFLLGRHADQQPDVWQAMFLPDYLRAEVEKRLGAVPEVVYERQGRPFSQDEGTGRGFVVLSALLLALPVFLLRKSRLLRLGVALCAVPLGLLGILVWGLALISSLAELRWNEAVLLFVPFDLALPFLGLELRQRYAQVRVVVILLVSVGLALGVFRQPLWVPSLVAFLPLLLLALPQTAPGSAPQEERQPA